MNYPLFIAILIVTVVLVTIYVYKKSYSLLKAYGKNPTTKKTRWIRLLVSILLGLFSCNIGNTVTIIFLLLLAAFVIVDLCAILLRRLMKKAEKTWLYRSMKKVYRLGILPCILCLLVTCYGLYNMSQVQKTEYSIATFKDISDYKIALLTDIHYDTVQSNALLQEKIEEINAQSPDIVILGGDIVEEDTSKEKMQEAFRVLGQMKNKHGIYYVYGNHDRQSYSKEPAYTREELKQAIEKNGIQILQDCFVEIQDDLILAGRDDAAWNADSSRKTSTELFKGVTQETKDKKFMLLIDHQPIQVEENLLEGVDLQLSGHTHAGQIWPVGAISELAGTRNYGMYHCGTGRLIVSSGFAGWRYPLRTGKHCEYVMVHLHNQNK